MSSKKLKHKQVKQLKLTVEQLLDRKDYVGAAQLLQSKVEAEPTDNNKRLLIRCLININTLEKYADIIDISRCSKVL